MERFQVGLRRLVAAVFLLELLDVLDLARFIEGIGHVPDDVVLVAHKLLVDVVVVTRHDMRLFSPRPFRRPRGFAHW